MDADLRHRLHNENPESFHGKLWTLEFDNDCAIIEMSDDLFSTAWLVFTVLSDAGILEPIIQEELTL